MIWAGPACSRKSEPKLAGPAPTLQPVPDARERARALDGFRDAAGDYRSQDPPRPAPPRGRWSDLPRAVSLAAAEVEMAVFREVALPDRLEYVLRTIDDRPATLSVRRTHDERVWTAEATVGRFDDDPARGQALLDQLALTMARLAKSPDYDDS
ncbi:MAG: hypothetical protein ACYTG1_02870 [Planctomycetota bacterium]